MNAGNAAELLAQPDIDGGLIGGASLKPVDFSKIVAATAQGACRMSNEQSRAYHPRWLRHRRAERPATPFTWLRTPVMDSLLQRWPHTKLSRPPGLDVGLPDGQMGNSEVGHTNIGSGRVVFQDLPRITNAIEDGTFFENPVYAAAHGRMRANGKAAASPRPAVRRRGSQPHPAHLRAW